ncbi:hypothetical protein EAF00_009435 [Botryotinia globosa]|nr:hypothetical protein EAF00_009435 [Botryotinia globosa]
MNGSLYLESVAVLKIHGFLTCLLYEPNSNAFTSYELYSFTSGCSEVASIIAYLNAMIVNPGFDNTRAILYYNAQILNLSLWFAKLTGADISNIAIQTLHIVTNLCPQTQARCTGAHQVYSSPGRMSSDALAKPFGTFDETWDNIVCRLAHVVLTLVRLEVHCPHVGPTGCMKCVDYDYNQGYLTDDLALFGSHDAFRCPGE